MSLARIPLPSFALVLTSDVVFLPTRPSVSAEHASNHSNDIQFQRCDTLPTADEQPLINALNDSATDFGQSEGDDESNTKIEEKPTTSRGSHSNNVKLVFMTLATAIRKLLRAIPKGRTSRVERKVDTQH